MMGTVPSGKGDAHLFLKVSVTFLVLLAAPAVHACDAVLEATVAAHPDDFDSRDALARSCAKAGRPSDALAQYDLLLAHDANNVDWLLGKSQALIALRRPREALPDLEKGRALAPAYEDVWRLNASALDQLDEFDAADALLTQAAAQFPQSTWPSERKAALHERRLLERGSRLSADVSYEDLSGGRDPWKGASIGLDHRFGDSRHLFAACITKNASMPAMSSCCSALLAA
jgi:tetratricopeptide (TPR) repeat protein